jgi:fumarate hydratase class I
MEVVVRFSGGTLSFEPAATFVDPLVELIRHTSSGLGKDVIAAIERAREGEDVGSRAHTTFGLMLDNVKRARELSSPICQDTGTLIFYEDYGPELSPFEVEDAIKEAVRRATAKAYLRPNTVDSITGQNIAENIGPGSPYIHLHPKREAGLRVRLMMKGGGCENVGAQYSLPNADLGAGRDLDGVRRCIIDAVQKAQGFGCAPGTVGVGVGGDRVTSYIESKEQLFRPLEDDNPEPKLDAIEKELTSSLNSLGIGPMGWGGKTTILGVKIGHRARVPASFFVSISYMCWAYRKGELTRRDGAWSLDGAPLSAKTPEGQRLSVVG